MQSRTLFAGIQALAFLLAVGRVCAEGEGDMRTRNNLRGQRYGEMIVVTGGPFTFNGAVYNTLGLNDCPEALWKSLDPRALKKEYRAVAVILNGPRYFLMDRNSLANPGKTAKFGGLEARHLADVRVSLPSVLRGKSKPYVENTVARTTDYLYRKGKRVYELSAPDGRRYVMQTYAQIVDPSLTEDALRDLGARLKLPHGWHYGSRILDGDMVLRARGTAHVVQDDFENSYQRAD